MDKRKYLKFASLVDILNVQAVCGLISSNLTSTKLNQNISDQAYTCFSGWDENTSWGTDNLINVKFHQLCDLQSTQWFVKCLSN